MKPIHLAVIAIAAAGGWFAARLSDHFHRSNGTEQRKILLYQSPMHPWVKSDKPGQCTVCGMDLVPVYEGDATHDKPAPGLVMLPQGSPNVVGVRTMEVKKMPLQRTLRISGMIGEDMSRHGVISAPVEGRIDGLSMNHAGQQVTRRQPLATVFSRTLLGAANDYNVALNQNPEAAAAAKRRLEQYGLVWEQIQTIPQRQPDDLYFGILSPLTGVIVKSYVAEGQFVKEGEKMFEIADFTKMWFMFSAAESDLPFLKVGQMVTLSTAQLPGENFKGRLAFINPNLDEMTHTSMVRVVLENPERRIKNNTYAEGTVELEAPEVTAIPRSAVLWSGTTPRVYVEKAAGSYQQRTVKLGRHGDADWEALEGLREGERVVTSGNMLIDSQAQLDAMALTSEPPPPSHLPDLPAVTAFMKAVASLNTFLAGDDLPAANEVLQQIPPIPDGMIKTPAPISSTDLKSFRQSFLPWSQEIAALAISLKSSLPDIHVFRCPMTDQLWPGAPANAAWIQFTGELRNPYWGKEMLECGIEVSP